MGHSVNVIWNLAKRAFHLQIVVGISFRLHPVHSRNRSTSIVAEEGYDHDIIFIAA